MSKYALKSDSSAGGHLENLAFAGGAVSSAVV
jgi:hypothetical protein